MGKLHVFNTISLDGFFTDANGDMSWAHGGNDDAEWNEFVSGNASGGGALMFGRMTYDMMVAFWPTPAAMQSMPAVAKGMNEMRKYVVSRTMKHAAWQNTSVVTGDIAAEVRRLKESEADVTILGSGSVVSQLTEAHLIDSFQLVIKPVIIGKGRSLFETVTDRTVLKRTSERAFRNGNVVVSYAAETRR
jgi:dihydrofolate reductase